MLSTLEEMILAVTSPGQGRKTGNCLIVPNHCRQMLMFGRRQGVELYPLQDDSKGTRKRFLRNWWKQNRLDSIQDYIWNQVVCRGEVLGYLRPTPTGYRTLFFEKKNYRIYHDEFGDIGKAIVKYSYQINPADTSLARNWSGATTRWVRLVLTKTQIEVSHYINEPDLDHAYQRVDQFTQRSVDVNTLGFIPFVQLQNQTTPGGISPGDFDALKDQIEELHLVQTAIANNIKFFGNPTLITSMSLEEVSETFNGPAVMRPTMASNAGFMGAGNPYYNRGSREWFSGEDGLRVKRVVANVSETDRLGYIMPDPVSPDQTRWAREQQEAIHTALGGVDPLGLSTGATAFEVKSVFGRSAATAKVKAENIYTHGLCRLAEMAIAVEERLFKVALASQLGAPQEDVTDDVVYWLMEEGRLPKGLPGLPPMGSRDVSWRWTGPVFEPSAQDLLQHSIIVRNMEESGVDTLNSMAWMLPDKTELEIQSMLRGFPFREAERSANVLARLVSIQRELLSTPDIEVGGGVPLADRYNIQGLIDKTISHIDRRISYGLQPEPAADLVGGSQSDRLPNGGYSSTRLPTNLPTSVPTDTTGADWSSAIPTPGSVVSSVPVSPTTYVDPRLWGGNVDPAVSAGSPAGPSVNDVDQSNRPTRSDRVASRVQRRSNPRK